MADHIPIRRLFRIRRGHDRLYRRDPSRHRGPNHRRGPNRRHDPSRVLVQTRRVEAEALAVEQMGNCPI